MADNDIKRNMDSRQKYYSKTQTGSNSSIPKCYQWIEDKLLKISIPDYRKITVDLILVPFFIVIKKFTANETFDLITEYLNKCHELQPLHPSLTDFEKRIKMAIEKTIDKKIPPIKIENIRNKYYQWYNFFNQWDILK